MYDAILYYGSILDVPLSKELIQYAKMARMRYHEALEKQKNEKEKKVETKKHKISQQIKLL